MKRNDHLRNEQTQLCKILEKNLRNIYKENNEKTTTLCFDVILVKERIIWQHNRGQRRNIYQEYKQDTLTLCHRATRVSERVVRVGMTQDKGFDGCQNGKVYFSSKTSSTTPHSQYRRARSLFEREGSRSDLQVRQLRQVYKIRPVQHTHFQMKRSGNHGSNILRS